MKMTRFSPFTAAILVATLSLSNCGNGNNSNGKNGKDSTAAVPVEVAWAITGDVSTFFTGTTTLDSEEDALVVAQVGGIVENIYVEEGDKVYAGDALAQLEDEMYRIQLTQSEATLRRLESEYQRNEAMFQKNAVSAQIFQRSKYDFQSQQAAHELAQLNLDYTIIRAPISGVLSERKIKVGNMVLTNSEIFRITNFDPLVAILHLPERELDKLAVNQKAILNVDALQDQEFVGYIDRISPVVNPGTGTVKVTIEVQNPSGRLKAGMFARIGIIYDTHGNALLVPKDAVLREDTESAVFIVQDSLAFRRVIETGYNNSTHVEILKGISKDDLLVTAGQGSLKDSTEVELIQP